ncbi:reprolysin-like metallo-peptidase family M12B [Idiomarina aquatica]|uniref:Reprolysin-like metallo-peptidase family M12B n=1 Tax=Idiomarina aquatica TaxID=1327752 RepID=A0A4R6PP94_9GAMM|nr:zinc-dependent metalloprotease family protein [Idiomarina aquatica]TDP40199.1 reprolysin-like metallo-peptidase family M12B [Idiomarina aquatica]
MTLKPLVLAALLSASFPLSALADTAPVNSDYPDVHSMMTAGNLIVGSTLDVAGQTLRIANNSKPERGFLVLESLRQVNGRNAYRGFIQQGPDVTLTVLQHNDGSMTKIYQSEKGVEIKQLDGVRKEPLKPDLAEVARAPGTSMVWTSNGPRAEGTSYDNAVQLSPPYVDSGLNSVDTLVLFDPRLPARVNMVGRQFETDLDGAMNLTQTIFENSELAFSHNLAATHAISLPSTTERYINSPSEDILDELVASGEVQRLKDIYDADVVHYIGITDDVCGQAFVASEVDLDNEFNSTSLDFHAAYTNYGCLGNGTFAHELGHNLALYHDRYTLANNEDGAGESFDNHIPYGYIEPEGQFYTTMAYQSSCTDVFEGAACDIAPIYSNPDVLLEGSPAGASDAVVDSANASRALGLTLPWAVGYSTLQDYVTLSLEPNGDGSADLTWVENSGASYVLLNRSCYENRFFTAAQIAAGTEVSGGTAEGSLIDTTSLRACLLESQDGSGDGYRAVGEYQANIDQSGNEPAYVLARANSVWVYNSSLTQGIDFWVSDENIANSDIAVAVYTDANGGRPALSDGIAQANEWIDATISGSGPERTLTFDFVKTPAEIAAELGQDDLRNPFNLPMAIVDTRFNEYRVSSVFWLNDDPEQPNKGLPYGFFESGEFLLDEQPYDIAVLLNNIPDDASVSVEQTGDITLPNFSYSISSGDTPSQRVIEVEGDPVTIESNGVWELTASWGARADQQVTLSLPGYAEDGNRVRDVRVLSDLVEGEDILLEVTLADLEDNSFWDTLEIRRLVPGEDDVVFDTPQSQDGNVFVFNLGQLDAGDYEFQIVLDYVDGGQVAYSLELTVTEGNGGGGGDVNQPPTVSVSGPSGNVEVDESFTVSASGSDPDGDSLTYAWEQTGGSDLTLSGVDSDSLTVTATAEGSYTVAVTVTDTSGATATASFDFTAEVTPVAPPPVPEPESGGSSGGSTGWLVILLGLMGLARRYRAS